MVAGGNYGWPCYEGPEPAGVYNLQAVYPAVCASKTFNRAWQDFNGSGGLGWGAIHAGRSSRHAAHTHAWPSFRHHHLRRHPPTPAAPAIAYKHPDNPPPGNVMSISAVGGNPENGRLYYGEAGPPRRGRDGRVGARTSLAPHARCGGHWVQSTASPPSPRRAALQATTRRGGSAAWTT